MALTDKTLVCRECGEDFNFTVGEQEFYASRGLMNEPRRCPKCRTARRRERQDSYGDSKRSYSAVCATCGAETTVPFEPTAGRPVYCKDCYVKVKQSATSEA